MDQVKLQDTISQAIRAKAEGLAMAVGGVFETSVKRDGDPREFEVRFREILQGFACGLLARTLEWSDGNLRRVVRERGHRAENGRRYHGRLRSKGVKKVTVTTLVGPVTPRRVTAECAVCGRWLGTVKEDE